MSNQAILQFIANNKPILNMEYAILSAPVRHTFMIGTIWYLTKQQRNPNVQILEIGSWVGASALSWAQGLQEFNDARGTITCLDGWKPFFDRKTHNNDVYVKMEQALTTDAAYQLFMHNTGTLPETITCQHLRGKSNDLLPLLKENSFEVVFIDADHAYTPVLKDIKNSLALVKEGGIICGDDLNLQLHQVNKEITQQNAEMDCIQDANFKRNYHPGVTLAVAEMFGEVSSWGGFWAMQKCHGQWKPVSLNGMPIIYPAHFPENTVKKAAEHMKDIKIA